MKKLSKATHPLPAGSLHDAGFPPLPFWSNSGLKIKINLLKTNLLAVALLFAVGAFTLMPMTASAKNYFSVPEKGPGGR
ncbi:MAG: hypothetical protein D3924_07285, partial [Candidatus Electrothrix sp. AR4]|nr:hypothetical protein [Candidatus Electrothrix sp. AR4]